MSDYKDNSVSGKFDSFIHDYFEQEVRKAPEKPLPDIKLRQELLRRENLKITQPRKIFRGNTVPTVLKAAVVIIALGCSTYGMTLPSNLSPGKGFERLMTDQTIREEIRQVYRNIGESAGECIRQQFEAS